MNQRFSHLLPSLLVLPIFILTFHPTLHAQPVGPGWANEQVTTHYHLKGYPVAMRFTPDGKLLVAEKHGSIKISDPENQALPVSPTVFMTIPKVEYQWERGLMDMVLDPDFANNGRFYVYYNHAYNPDTAYFRVSRFTTDTGNGLGVGDSTSEVLLWEDDENSFQYHAHYGGSLNFAPDGTLLITNGEKFDSNFSQDTTRFAGKVLRINTDGSIPVDNPLAGNPYGWREEVYAIGLRQPFRCYMDQSTGRFFISDVGKSGINTSWEDTHVLQFPVPGNPSIVPDTAMVNFGHPMHEGYTPPLTPGNYPAGFPEPIFTYPHAGQEAAVIGGFVYNGSTFPSRFYGAYFYADYSRDQIYCLFSEAGNTWRDTVFATSPDPNEFFRPVNRVVSLVQSPGGALYYINYTLQEIRRITYSGVNNSPPVCGNPTASPSSGTGSSLTTTFNAGSPTDPNGDPLTFNWIFGDGNTSTQENPAHTYTSAGTYTAQLRISDGTFTVTCNPITISVGDPPTATITSPINTYLFNAGEIINFSGTGTDNQDGNLPGSQMEWNIVFDHNTHTHTGLNGYNGVSGTFPIPDHGSHNFSENTGYTLCLTVTDSDGLTDTECIEIFPRKTNFTFLTSPPGLNIILDGGPQDHGYVLDDAVGFEHEVSAPATVCLAGIEYQWQSWSDGGAATHTFTIPNANDTLIAVFIPTGNTCSDCGSSTTNGLVARWDFSAGSGSTVYDNSGVTPLMDLTIEDPSRTTWVQDGLRLNSSTRVMSSGADSKIYAACTATNELTVEAWVEPTSITQQEPAPIVSLSVRPGNRNFMVGQRHNGTDGRWTAHTRTSGTAGEGTPEFDPNTWSGFSSPALMHVVYIRETDGDEYMYVNGNLVESGTATKTGSFSAAWAWQNTATFVIGGEKEDPAVTWDQPKNWLGTYYLVSVYDRALSATEVGQNYISGCGLPTTPVLAAEVSRFTATQMNAQVRLDWTTETENNHDRFEVERASSGGFFTMIGSVDAIGHSLEANSYSLLDPNPQPGINAYRLKLIDNNGSFVYSNVIELYVDEGKDFALYPNPAKDVLNIQSLSNRHRITTLELFDLMGRKVWYETWDAQDSPLRQLPVGRFSKGVYFYTVGDENLYQTGKITIE